MAGRAGLDAWVVVAVVAEAVGGRAGEEALEGGVAADASRGVGARGATVVAGLATGG